MDVSAKVEIAAGELLALFYAPMNDKKTHKVRSQ